MEIVFFLRTVTDKNIGIKYKKQALRLLKCLREKWYRADKPVISPSLCRGEIHSGIENNTQETPTKRLECT